MDASFNCPSCRRPMERRTYERLPLGSVAVDLCFVCRTIWFDVNESPQLAPGGVVALFADIHAHRDTERIPCGATPACPRCATRLTYTHDLTRHGPFAYHRCVEGHGRLIAFAQLLTEKGFVRHLSKKETAQLAASLTQIACHSCGAPIDLKNDTKCRHCGSALAILDRDAVAKALADYHGRFPRAREPSGGSLADFINLQAQNGGDIGVHDLVESGFDQIAGWQHEE